jgi:hypothetical protein
MFFRSVVLCLSFILVSSASAEDILQDILDVLTEFGDSMVSVSNVSVSNARIGATKNVRREVFRT